MNFLNISPLFFGAGLAALAVGLYILQQLRIRYTQLPVATTMFWAEAVRDAPVRVFRQRFKHWLAYLLALLICWLLWVGFSDLETDDTGASDFYVMVLDGSAGAAVSNEFELSKQDLLSDIGSYPLDQREVYLAAGQNTRLLAPDENSLVLDRRLDEVEPVSAPSSVDDLVRILSRGVTEEGSLNIIVYGRSTIPQETVENLPESVNIQWSIPNNEDFVNRGIVALGIGEPLSGAWDKVDVLLRILSTETNPIDPSELTLTLGDQPLDSNSLTTLNDTDFLLKDVPANGLLLHAVLAGDDDLPFDNQASVALPLKTPINIVLGANVSPSLLPALRADEALTIVEQVGDADIAIIGPGDPPTTLPTFSIVPIEEQETAFLIGIDEGDDAQLALERAVDELGIRQIDAVAIATEIEREVEVMMEISDQRYISIWQPIVEDEFNFRDSFSFPLFVSKSMRYLADDPPWYAYFAAGKPAIEQSAGASLAETDVLADLAVGTYYVRNEAGEFEIAEDLTGGVVSLLDSSSTVRNQSQVISSELVTQTSVYPRWSLLTWLMLLVFLLIVSEWYIYQRRLMP